MLEQTKFFTIMTLNQVLCGLLRSLASDNEKMNQSLQIILQTTIQILQAESRQSKLGVFYELLTEFFASVIEQTAKLDSNLIKPYRKDIIELFNVDTFF